MTFAIPELATAFMLTFARIGTLVMLMPGIGERMISPRLRLGFALLLSVVLFPLTRTLLPASAAPQSALALLAGELAVGFMLGLATRMVVAALQTAGNIVAQQLEIAAVRDSYAFLPPTGIPGTGDAAALAIKAVGRGFALAVQLAAPFIAFGILFNLGVGVLSRLMPQLQVFFLAMPATILIGMAVLLAVVGTMMGVFVSALGDFMRELGGR